MKRTWLIPVLLLAAASAFAAPGRNAPDETVLQAEPAGDEKKTVENEIVIPASLDNKWNKYWLYRMARGFVERQTKPNPKLDPEWIYQPLLPWRISMDNSFSSNDILLHSDISQHLAKPGGAETLTGTLDESLSHQDLRVGNSFGYGGLRLSVGIPVRMLHKDPENSQGKSRYYSLSTSQPSFGVTLQYYQFFDPIYGNLNIKPREGVEAFDNDTCPGRTRKFSAEAYYTLNSSRFSYSATSARNVVQRRSAGSWMLYGKFLQGDVRWTNANADFQELTHGLALYRTIQLAIGGGYSYNWVIYNRMPSSPGSNKGLRNLTFNLTALPSLTLYNHLQAFAYNGEEEAFRQRFNGWPTPALCARTGLVYSWDRFSIFAQGNYTGFGFLAFNQTLNSEDGLTRSEIKSRALFSEWRVSLQLCVDF